jgi:hypothetical protein
LKTIKIKKTKKAKIEEHNFGLASIKLKIKPSIECHDRPT